jgi:hypothetical protein
MTEMKHDWIENPNGDQRVCVNCDMQEYFEEGQWWPIVTSGIKNCEMGRGKELSS